MTALLLDTNVISELVRPAPNPQVLAFLKRLTPEEQFTAAICLAELRYGIERMPMGKRRDQYHQILSPFLSLTLQGRILAFDDACADLYGKIRTAREQRGQIISVQDAMIAATARAHSLTVATRNIKDFAGCRIPLINPWEGP